MTTENTPSELGSTTPSPVAIQIIESVIESREERGLGWAQTTWAVDNLTRPLLAENAKLREALTVAHEAMKDCDLVVAAIAPLLAENAKLREALDCTLSWMKQHHPTAYENSHKARSALDATK
ncbi:MAG: hypothetical protein GY720_15795 [bacterium]|nr:hypothetical protein [bacterium]